MIFIYLRLPYRRQLRAIEPETLSLVDGAVDSISLQFNARVRKTDLRTLLSFDEAEGCAALRASEALRRLAETLAELALRLHGYTILLDRSEHDATDVLEDFDRHWLRLPDDGVWARSEGLPYFNAFIRGGARENDLVKIEGFSLSDPLLPPSWKAPEADPSLVDEAASILEAMRRERAGAEILLVIGPEEAAKGLAEAAIDRLSSEDSPILRGGAGGEATPLAPFFAFPAPVPEDSGDAAEAARSVAVGLCRQRHEPALLEAYASHLRTCVGIWDRGEGKGPGWIVFDNFDKFSSEALSVLSSMLRRREENRASNAPLFVAWGNQVPKNLPDGLLRILHVGSLGSKSLAESAKAGAEAIGRPSLGPSLASAARGQIFRLRLVLRLAWRGVPETEERPAWDGVDTEDLIALAMEGIPAEFGGWLRALCLSEDILDDAAFDEFLSKAGYSRGIRPRISSAMAHLGFVVDAKRPRVARRDLRDWIDLRLGKFDKIDRGFAAELSGLYARKRVAPSLALYSRLVQADPAARMRTAFFLDALAADMTQGPSMKEEKFTAADSAFELCVPLFRSWTGSSGEEAAKCLEAFSAASTGASPASLDAAMLSFARAIDAFCRATVKTDASPIRNAVIRFHEFGALRAEAKAHRLLGLAALTGGQIAEAADYLGNADELASSIPDGMESFLSSLAAAGALFTLGDITRAGLRIEKAEEAARASFRPDWALGSAFAAARLDFELGRYGAAAGTFEGIARKAEELGDAEAGKRAKIWAARAASWSGMSTRSRAVLASSPEDPEASWFLAEIASWEGDWRQAAVLADRARTTLVTRSWRPIDAISWKSGFDLLEGPCLGSWPSETYLEDQIGAFATYAHAMAERDPARIVELADRSRDGRLAPIHHPQGHLFDWYAYVASGMLETPPIDPGTLLSRAWKSLQTRTLRIEESSLKTQFLEGNRWNREIVAAARARRLI
ncbi:MAG TPA: hypothetical protein VMV83_14100 [Rectinemataceae bacterium]|nr:hypothetical protein [Rectinemataceae bacterium]